MSISDAKKMCFFFALLSFAMCVILALAEQNQSKIETPSHNGATHVNIETQTQAASPADVPTTEQSQSE